MEEEDKTMSWEQYGLACKARVDELQETIDALLKDNTNLRSQVIVLSGVLRHLPPRFALQ